MADAAPGPAGAAVLEAESLSVPGRLHAVSLRLRAGRLCALLGPNGAGKSTLLDLLSGRQPPSTGHVRLGGTPLAALDQAALARRRAVLRQREPLAPGLTVRAFVHLGRLPWQGVAAPAEDDRRVVEALRATELEAFAGRFTDSLSGGERQRARLARALAQLPAAGARAGGLAPGLLLLDEPAAHLDPARQHAALGLARRLADGGAAVLAVLHEPALAAAFADDVVLLGGGRVVAAGPAAETLTPTRLEALYGVPFTTLETPGGRYPVAVPRPWRP